MVSSILIVLIPTAIERHQTLNHGATQESELTPSSVIR